jgi:hypothetical protein
VLANIFAGVQLVFSDALRVDDVVVVEGEWGRIGEITLSYVVVDIWDDRRLVCPARTSPPSHSRTGRAPAASCSARSSSTWTGAYRRGACARNSRGFSSRPAVGPARLGSAGHRCDERIRPGAGARHGDRRADAVRPALLRARAPRRLGAPKHPGHPRAAC